MPGLPDQREYDVVDGGPITHVLANAVQDQIIAALRGQRTWYYHPSDYELQNGSASYASASGFDVANTAVVVTCPLRIPQGANIDEVKVWLDENSISSSITCRLVQANTDFTYSSIDNAASAGDGSKNEVTLTPDHLQANDAALAVAVEIGSAGQRVGVVRVKWTPTASV